MRILFRRRVFFHSLLMCPSIYVSMYRWEDARMGHSYFIILCIPASLTLSLPPSPDVVKTRLQTDPERYEGLGIWGACEKIR